MAKDEKTTRDIETLISNIVSLVDLFNDLKIKVNKIENLIEGKATEGINSMYNDVQTLKKQINEIDEKINFEIIENINILQVDFKQYTKINENIDTLNQRVLSIEMYKESKQSIEKFLAYVVPFLSFGLAIIVSLLMPIFKGLK